MNKPLSLPPLLAQHTTQHSAHSLPLEKAWAVALQWRHLSRDQVLLERTPDDSAGLAKSYEWIRFEIDINNRVEVSAARAAAVAWFALSCCPGYGGHENPVFWKCVFSELACAHTGSTFPSVESITDACGFFDGDGVDFPRFKLKVNCDERNVLLFCGDASEELEPDDKANLEQAITTLSPWVNQMRAMRRPVVSLFGVDARDFIPIHAEIERVESQGLIQSKLSQFISDAIQDSGKGWQSPIFVVREIVLRCESCFDNARKQQWYHEVTRTDAVEIKCCICYEHKALPREALASIVRDTLCLPGSGARARMTVFRVGTKDLYSLPAFASALPFASSIRSVWLDITEPQDREFVEKTALVWIAYALFHPNTPATPWKSLSIKNTVLRERMIPILQAMARGNNLVAMLDGREAASDGYYSARLAASAYIVYDQPDPSLHDEVAPMATTDGETEVEVCDVAGDDPVTWTEWVAVVVPAYGLAWVRSADLIGVVKRAPAEATLTHLLLNASEFRLDKGVSMRSAILSVLGRRLVHLDMRWYGGFATKSDLLHALGCCPCLESLVVTYQDNIWDSEAVASVLPRLRELELCVHGYVGEGARVAVFNVPSSLHLLRINVAFGHNIYHRSLDAVRHILTQPSQLRVFHWDDGLHSSHEARTPYTEICADTERRLEELGIPHRSIERLDVRLPAPCAAAFWSVIAQEDRSSAVTRLDEELTKIIIAFAGARRKRSIVLAPGRDDVVVPEVHYNDVHVDYFGDALERQQERFRDRIRIREVEETIVSCLHPLTRH